ncbi:NUDIX hydrolase [Aspergillus ruber CBS 135680]|uniref:NUDIX domain protein n=1 Tax=Aspergillus ruber (strain CBS 135680) TaxID=1388766 RepID=A0A017SRL6_ASPRC|nr:NUDIX domain protein [Aspergillus ruber CBS 135680]EYE99229.1 NUDIX domain protein [Aspergillus ruber CBS 135680]
MPRLNPRSQAAIDRLRSYKPPPTNYDLLPLTRRAAVLLLLYADAKGDLRIVLTIRAKTLSSYAGHAALPGGRADTLEESPFQTSRREAREEIGLPETNVSLPSPFIVEHLCELPANLAWTELVVRPCVALLHSYDEKTGVNEDPEVSLIPRLDAREVAAVFTAPFHNFLKQEDEVLTGSGGEAVEGQAGSARPGKWYSGAWTEWHQSNWRMHQFFVPVRDKSVTKPKPRNQTPAQKHAVDKLSQDEHEREKAGQSTTRFRVHGMTARMLVDAARVAYAEEPEFEHNSDFGDEEMITRLMRMGRLSAVRRKGDKLTKEDMQRAAKLS